MSDPDPAPDLDIVDMLTKGESNLLKTDTEDGEGEAKNEDLDAEDTKVEVEEEQNSLMSSLEVKQFRNIQESARSFDN